MLLASSPDKARAAVTQGAFPLIAVVLLALGLARSALSVSVRPAAGYGHAGWGTPTRGRGIPSGTEEAYMSDTRVHADGGRLQMPRSRGAASGFLLVLLGIWGALIPFVGPYFDFAFTPDREWTWTTARGWLEVLPG